MHRLLPLAALFCLATPCFANSDWTRFRGPDGSGHATGAPIPATWSLNDNLVWRQPLPGKGVSSPIVSRDRVYLTAYTGYGIDPAKPGATDGLVRHLLAFDRDTGKELWKFSIAAPPVEEDPYRGMLTQHGYASNTPVTDGERIYVLFGKAGAFAVDLDGKEVWRRDLGQLSDPARWGDASSPVLAGDLLLINAAVVGRKLVALDRRTGEQVWSIEDPSFTNSWTSPTVIGDGDNKQVLITFPKRLLGVELQTGNIVWEAAIPINDGTTPGVVTHDGVAFVIGSREGHAMAVRTDGRGDVTDTHVVWQKRARAGIATPIVLDAGLFWASSGIFFALDRTTGELLYRARLPRKGAATGGFPNVDYSSPVAQGDRIVQFTRNGESYVISAGETFEVIAHNPPPEDDTSAFSSTPAIADGSLYIRSDRYLYRFGTSSEEP